MNATAILKLKPWKAYRVKGMTTIFLMLVDGLFYFRNVRNGEVIALSMGDAILAKRATTKKA